MDENGLASFGEMLKAYRKRRGLTQQQLARKLSLHHNTIGAWERGDYLPSTRGIIRELARCLHLDETETHHLLDVSLITVMSRWCVPHQRNPFFTGRQATLERLHIFLSGKQGLVSNRSCVLRGLGGIGKTQTAVEYAYRHSLDYAAVFWVNAETEELVLGSFAAIARALQLPVHYIQKQEEVVEMVLDWLNTRRDWLLIFDNVEARGPITRFVPSSQNGSLLFTTRLPTLGTLAPCLELQPLPMEESMQLLLRRAGMQQLHQPPISISADEEDAARAITKAMDGLPLALDQAAAYIEESHCRFVGFLSLFQYDILHLLQNHPSSVIYPHSVAKTFTLAFERLQRHDPVAADLLTLCCFLSPDEIPEDLLINGRSQLKPELQSVLSDPFRLNDTFKNLLAYALLHRNTQTRTFNVHRLVQTVLKERLSEEAQRAWIEPLIRLLDQLLLIEQGRWDAEHWAWCEQLLPHAHGIFQLANQLQLVSSELGSLLRKVATYLFQRAHYEQAEQLYLRALSIQEQVKEADHPDLILTLTGLARTHLEQGKYQEVEAYLRRAIAVGEACLGPEHLQLALPLQGLAYFCAYIDGQKYDEGEKLYLRALHIRRQHQGERHLDVATVLDELAIFYYNRGDYRQAMPLFLQVLHLREQVLDADHPEMAESLFNMGTLYGRQARYHEAEPLLQRSLSLYEQALGPDHFKVATVLNNLAHLYLEQAKYEQAEQLYQRGLTIGKQVLGADDTFVALLLDKLAILYGHQGRYEEAETLATRALSLYQQSLLPEHRLLSDPLHTLAWLAYQQGQYTQAETFSSRALAIRERTMPNHPGLAATLHLQANLRREMCRYEEAEFLYQRALCLYQRCLGPEHKDIALLEDDFATLFVRQNPREEAEQHYQEALHIWERYQDLNHPSHADCLEHYVLLLKRQRREMEASSYYRQAWQIRDRRQIESQQSIQNGHMALETLCEEEAATGNL